MEQLPCGDGVGFANPPSFPECIAWMAWADMQALEPWQSQIYGRTPGLASYLKPYLSWPSSGLSKGERGTTAEVPVHSVEKLLSESDSSSKQKPSGTN